MKFQAEILQSHDSSKRYASDIVTWTILHIYQVCKRRKIHSASKIYASKWSHNIPIISPSVCEQP